MGLTYQQKQLIKSLPDLNRYNSDGIKFLKDKNERYGWSYIDFDKMMRYFNLSRLPDYENMPEPYIGYILMSKPILNLDGNNIDALKNHPMTSAFMNDTYGYQMMKALGETAVNPWLPVITTKAKNYSVSDVELKTVDKGNTYYGHSIKYGKHSEDHKVAGNISIDFRNDRYLSVLKMMYLWMCYIYLVSKTDVIAPTSANQMNAILDYVGSLYFLVTRRDGRELVYWEKLTGIFPTRSPMSIFSFSDELIIQDTISIDFTYCVKSDPCDPAVLADINYLSNNYSSAIASKTVGASSLYDIKSLYNGEGPFIKGDIFAYSPFVRISKVNGNLRYYLDWEGDGLTQKSAMNSNRPNSNPTQTRPNRLFISR